MTLRRACLGALFALSGVLAVWAPASAGRPSHRGEGGHGHGNGLVGYPSFLPKSTLDYHSDALIVGTASRPALTSQGDPVKVVTAHWSAVVVVRGPEVPGEGLPHQAATTTCTWTVTVSRATGSVPVSAADFDSVDAKGQVFRPALVAGQATPPTVVEPGQTVTFEMRAAEPVGEDLMRWAPGGNQVVAKWDFVVEND